MSDLLTLRGAPGSPYTRKMLVVLRYRQIPYRLVLSGGALGEKKDLPEPKVQLIPVFYFEDNRGELEPMVDSTPIIRRLEEEYEGRSVIPTEPTVRFLNYLFIALFFRICVN